MPEITFCILTFNKTPWLGRTIRSISRHCPTGYFVKILVQGVPDRELSEFIANLSDPVIEVVRSPENLGCGGGRKILAPMVSSSLTMMLDDDMYLTNASMSNALEVLARRPDIGAVSMPQYNMRGRMISLGGRRLAIRHGVVRRIKPRTPTKADYVEVDDLDGGAMLFRTEMRNDFSWDERLEGAMEDLDKSIQIVKVGKWRQAIVPSGRLIHDRSWVGHRPTYEGKRFDGLTMRRSYRLFRQKWGLRLDLRTHFLFEVAYPMLTLARSPWGPSSLNKLFRK